MRGEWSLLENKKRKIFLFFFKQCKVLDSIQNLHIWKRPYFVCLHVQCKMYWVPLGMGLKNGIFSEIYQSTVDLQCYVNFRIPLLFFGTLFRCLYLSFSPLPSLLFFSQLVGPPKRTIFLFPFLFLGDSFYHCLLYSVTNLYPQFFRLYFPDSWGLCEDQKGSFWGCQ